MAAVPTLTRRRRGHWARTGAINPASGQQLKELVAEIYALPEAVVRKAGEVLNVSE